MIPIISCGTFQWELAKIIPEIEGELQEKITLQFLSAALDESDPTLENALKEGAAGLGKQPCAFLYGSMCHTAMHRVAEELNARYPAPANCAELLLGPDKKKELDALGNFYYLTSYGLREWRRLYKEGGHHWDEADARVHFGYFEKILVLDTGVIEITDEELFEFFDYAQIPVETEKITLDYFKAVVLELCRKVANHP